MIRTIAEQHHLPSTIEEIIQDMLVGPVKYWRNKFASVLIELPFRVHNKLAWQVEVYLESLPESVLQSIVKSTYEYIDRDDTHIQSKDAFEYHLKWGPDGNGPYSIEICLGRIQVEGIHSPSRYDQEAIDMVHRYGDYCSHKYMYLIEHDTYAELSDFIQSEIDYHTCFWNAV